MIELLGFTQSNDSLCGVASVRSILYYYGIDTTENEIAKRCNHTYELGCTNEDMAEALRSYGLGAFIQYNSTIEDLIYWNRFKVPVIVDYLVSSEDGPNGHSSIVVDVDKHNVYLLDPEDGKIKRLAHDDFQRIWFDWDVGERILPATKLNLGVMIVPYPDRLKV